MTDHDGSEMAWPSQGAGAGPPAAAGGLAELGAEAAVRREAGGRDALIACDRLVRIYSADGIEQQALQGLDLVVEDGELTAVVGASGSGKSTLLNILAGLDKPTAGSARVASHDLTAMGHQERLAYRRATVGFVWQQTSRNLLPYLTAVENVELPMRFGRARHRERHPRARELLGTLGVSHCADRRPAQMSGGEQQRVSIATALANRPKLLLADEPTGELDSTTAAEVFGALRDANTELGVTVLLVTHDPACPGRSGGSSRSGTAGPAPRPCIRSPRTNTATRRGRLSSTPCSIGPGGFSCPGSSPSRWACATGCACRRRGTTSACGRTYRVTVPGRRDGSLR